MLSGRWVDDTEFHVKPDHLYTDEELFEIEPDRTDKQAKFIIGLMVDTGVARLGELRKDFRTKKNGKISIGMAANVIKLLLEKKNETIN